MLATTPPPSRQMPRHVTENSKSVWEQRHTNAEYSGVVIPAKNDIPIKPQGVQAREARGIFHRFICPICTGGFSRRHSVYTHFHACITTNGNPEGKLWNDHQSCQAYKPRKRQGLYMSDRAAWKAKKARRGRA